MKTNNQVQLIGYVGNHLREFQCRFEKKLVLRVATHHKGKDDDGNAKYITTWHQVVAWGRLAEIAENNFVKGSHILVQGRLTYRDYRDKYGCRHTVAEIYATQLQNLDR